MASSSILSQTLQSITVTKIKELEKQRRSYEERRNEALDEAKAEMDICKRVFALLARVDKLDISSWRELENIRRWVDQAEYDPSISDATLSKFEEHLHSRLDIESRKLGLADLYSRLLTEWIDAPKNAESEPEIPENNSLDESFEMVQDRQRERLEQLRDKFERVVFEPLATDETKINNYLHSMFEGDAGEKALERLRNGVRNFGKRMLGENRLLDDRTLKWCIKALLRNDLLNDEKKASLKDILRDEAVLNEIRDVLNMRYGDLENWSWNLGGEGMPVMPRQSLNGKWRVIMDEDILEAIFTHWIGIKWSVCIKSSLREVAMQSGIWKHGDKMPYEEAQKRRYYMIPDAQVSVDQEREKTYRQHFFLAPLPFNLYDGIGAYEDDEDDDEEKESVNPNKLSPKDTKQLLLRTLATEVVVRKSIDGEVAVVQSDFQWFGTGIAHSTVFAVLRFVGFQEEWISFFKKVLEPPLDMLNGKPVRTRKRGLPVAHVFDKLLGELVLFFMDLAVNQEANMLLFRFHDDLWLAGKPRNCAKAWQSMKTFADIMGLEFNERKTGSVYLVEDGHRKDPSIAKTLPEGPVAVNFLNLDPDSGHWIINKEHVQEHVKQLQKQLTGSKSVLEWIKTWNSCIGRFFSYTFGDPANCFGRPHLDQVLATHKEMQQFLFETSGSGALATVTEHLKSLIAHRFSVPISDIPDAFLYLPEAFGGLGLQNPFIPLFLVRESFSDNDPDSIMQRFHEDEKAAYKSAKKQFEAMSHHVRTARYHNHFGSNNNYPTPASADNVLRWSSAQTFLSFAEFCSWRESSSQLLHETYKTLMSQPEPLEIHASDAVQRDIRRLRRWSEGAGNEMDWDKLSPETRWMVQYHADELFEKFDGLGMVDRMLLPLGVLQAMRERRVKWQMVL